MTAVGASTADVLYDMLLVFGLSVAVWMAYHILCLLLPMRSAFLAIPVHILFFAVAGFFCFCFILGQTTVAQPRWHLALGFMLGAWVYYAWFARYVRRLLFLLHQLLRLLAVPVAVLGRWIKTDIIDKLRLYLQKKRAMLYNKRIERQRARQAKRKSKRRESLGEQEEQPKKQAVRAYTQT